MNPFSFISSLSWAEIMMYAVFVAGLVGVLAYYAHAYILDEAHRHLLEHAPTRAPEAAREPFSPRTLDGIAEQLAAEMSQPASPHGP